MKFTKFGKALLMGALSAASSSAFRLAFRVIRSAICMSRGTVTAQPQGTALSTGFKIDHNTGAAGQNQWAARLFRRGQPGARRPHPRQPIPLRPQPRRQRRGNGNCTTANPCQNSNITQFAVGGNGILTPQQTFYTQGINPFRLIVDGTGQLPAGARPRFAFEQRPASLRIGQLRYTTCGDITVFPDQPDHGPLSLVVNAQVTAAGGQSLTYFPVPANPVDFVLSNNYVLTLTAPTSPTTFPYTGGNQVFPYAYSSTRAS